MDEYQPSERWLRQKERMKKRAEARGKQENKNGRLTVLALVMLLLLGGGTLLGANMLASLDSSRARSPVKPEESTDQAPVIEQPQKPKPEIARPESKSKQEASRLSDADTQAYAKEIERLKGSAAINRDGAKKIGDMGIAERYEPALNSAVEYHNKADRQERMAECLENQQQQLIAFYTALSTCETAFPGSKS